jgi:hypothetical protein
MPDSAGRLGQTERPAVRWTNDIPSEATSFWRPITAPMERWERKTGTAMKRVEWEFSTKEFWTKEFWTKE